MLGTGMRRRAFWRHRKERYGSTDVNPAEHWFMTTQSHVKGSGCRIQVSECVVGSQQYLSPAKYHPLPRDSSCMEKIIFREHLWTWSQQQLCPRTMPCPVALTDSINCNCRGLLVSVLQSCRSKWLLTEWLTTSLFLCISGGRKSKIKKCGGHGHLLENHHAAYDSDHPGRCKPEFSPLPWQAERRWTEVKQNINNSPQSSFVARHWGTYMNKVQK